MPDKFFIILRSLPCHLNVKSILYIMLFVPVISEEFDLPYQRQCLSGYFVKTGVKLSRVKREPMHNAIVRQAAFSSPELKVVV